MQKHSEINQLEIVISSVSMLLLSFTFLLLAFCV